MIREARSTTLPFLPVGHSGEQPWHSWRLDSVALKKAKKNAELMKFDHIWVSLVLGDPPINHRIPWGVNMFQYVSMV